MYRSRAWVMLLVEPHVDVWPLASCDWLTVVVWFVRSTQMKRSAAASQGTGLWGERSLTFSYGCLSYVMAEILEHKHTFGAAC